MPKQRNLSGIFAQIKKANESTQSEQAPSFKPIENLFQFKFKDNKTTVVIRFLPPNVNEYLAFVQNWSHIKKGFFCDCLEQYGKPCPICEHNHAVCKRYSKRGKNPATEEELAYRKTLLLPAQNKKFFSNILVVRNDNDPDTEGKVFRFRYGVQIFGKITDRMNGYEDSDDGWQEGINVFDWNEGANFTIEATSSEFGPKFNDEKTKFGKQKAINRWDRASKTYIPLTVAEQDAIESQLFTLDDIEKKEEDFKTADEIRAYVLKKTGKKLWYLTEDGTVVNPNKVESEKANSSYSAITEHETSTFDVETDNKSADDDFASNFSGGDVEDSAPVTESASSEEHFSDDQSFYDEMENM